MKEVLVDEDYIEMFADHWAEGFHGEESRANARRFLMQLQEELSEGQMLILDLFKPEDQPIIGFRFEKKPEGLVAIYGDPIYKD